MTRVVLRVIYGVVAVALSSYIWNTVDGTPPPLHRTTSTTTTSTSSLPPVTPTSAYRDGTTALSEQLAPVSSGDLDGMTVAIDPGHNGGNAAHPEIINRLVPDGRGMKACDTTGTATDSGFPESTFTFAVANKLAELLRQRGATVILTRSNNSSVGPCVNQRATIGNGADVALSIHGDGGPVDGRGFTVLTPTGVGPSMVMTKEAHRLAGIVRNHLENAYFYPSTYLGVQGIQPRSDLAGLNLSTTPKIFVECANMKNADDARDMQDPAWRDRLAGTLADAVAVFLTSRH